MASAEATARFPSRRAQAAMTYPRSTTPARRRSWPPASAMLGLVILAILCLGAAIGPWLWPVNPEAQDLMNRFAPPMGFGGSSSHPLGTDTVGRDMLARLISGARISLPLAIVATLAAGTIGLILGSVAGYRGGWADRLVTWLADVQLAIPFVVFAIVITVTMGNSIRNVLLTLVVTGWVSYARVIRLQTRSLRSTAWIEAARAMGAGPGRVLSRHLLPNLAVPAVILATQQVGAMILYESSLSFLGLGVAGSTITWGGMAALGRESIFKAPWVAAVPGAAIALTILGFNLTGDWLATRGRRQRWS